MARTKPSAEPIRTPRLVLRPAGAADIDDMIAEISDPGVARMLARVPWPYLRRDAEAFLASVSATEGQDLPLAIAVDGRLIGGIGLSGIRDEREFGYWLGRDHWGKGYATEAGRAFLAHVFNTFGAGPVNSGVFVDNPASMRVQAKLGFEKVGVSMRQCLARGRPVEHIDTILTRERFESLNP